MKQPINGYTEIPGSWCKILRAVQVMCPEAIIAGGAIRETLLGHPELIKDLDIFVNAYGERRDSLEPWLRDIGWTKLAGQEFTADYGRSVMRGEVHRVVGYDVPGFDLPVQVIYLTIGEFSPMRAIERMDFFACQLATDGTWLWSTLEALEDITNRMITMRRPDNMVQFRRSERRAARLRGKFTGTGVSVVSRWPDPVAEFNLGDCA